MIGSKEHQKVALDAARECIVLLKYQNKMLPLDAKKIESIAVVGINAGRSEFGDYSDGNASSLLLQRSGVRVI